MPSIIQPNNLYNMLTSTAKRWKLASRLLFLGFARRGTAAGVLQSEAIILNLGVGY